MDLFIDVEWSDPPMGSFSFKSFYVQGKKFSSQIRVPLAGMHIISGIHEKL